jgi:hypothetical protein
VGYGSRRCSGRFHRLRRFIELYATASSGLDHQLHREFRHHYCGTKRDPDRSLRQRDGRDYSRQHSCDERNACHCNADGDDDLYVDGDSGEWGSDHGDGQHHGKPGADHHQFCGQPGDDHGRAERNAYRGVCERHGRDYAGEYRRDQWNCGYCEPDGYDDLYADGDTVKWHSDHGDSDYHGESGGASSYDHELCCQSDDDYCGG